MLILGLDPGSRFTGYGLVAAEGSRLRLVEAGRLALPAGRPVPERLAALAAGLAALLDRHAPAAAAVERVFHGVNSRSLIVLAEARGVLLAGLAARGLEVAEYAPAEVRAALGGGAAGKAEVARLVRLLLGPAVVGLAPDASDALAVALCYSRRGPIDRLSEMARKAAGGARKSKLTPLRPRVSVPRRRP